MPPLELAVHSSQLALYGAQGEGRGMVVVGQTAVFGD